MHDDPGHGPRLEPVVRTKVATRDLGQASDIITRVYADNTFVVREHPKDFELRIDSATAGPLTTSLVQYGLAGRADAAPTDVFTTLLVCRTTMHMKVGSADPVDLTAGTVWLGDNERPVIARYESTSLFSMLQLPRGLLDEVASEVTGSDGAPMRFLDNSPIDDRARRYWTSLQSFAQQQAMAADSPLAAPTIRDQLVRTLAQAALVVFPNSTMTMDQPGGAGMVGPATLRRAVQHLHAHAAESVSVAEVAAAAGIGVRALQQACVRHLECTPTELLRRIRLERAHADLQVADPTSGDTVAGVAARWGFGHPGRFSAAYAARYGVLPKDTLRS